MAAVIREFRVAEGGLVILSSAASSFGNVVAGSANYGDVDFSQTDFRVTSETNSGTRTVILRAYATSDTRTETDEDFTVDFVEGGVSYQAHVVITDVAPSNVPTTPTMPTTPPPDGSIIASLSGPATFLEPDKGSADAVYTVKLVKAAANDVVVKLSIAGSGATLGADYAASTVSAVIKAGQTQADLRLGIIGDVIPESNDSIKATLSIDSGPAIVNAGAGSVQTSISDGTLTPGTGDALKALKYVTQIFKDGAKALASTVDDAGAAKELKIVENSAKALKFGFDIAAPLATAAENYYNREKASQAIADPQKKAAAHASNVAYWHAEAQTGLFKTAFVTVGTAYALGATGLELAVVGFAASAGVTLLTPAVIAIGLAIGSGIALGIVYDTFLKDMVTDSIYQDYVRNPSTLPAIPLGPSSLNNSHGSIPAAIVSSYVDGAAPSDARLGELTKFSLAQYDAYKGQGVARPEIGPYEALGASFGSTAAFQAKFANASSNQFVAQNYSDVFGRAPTTDQSNHFGEQVKFFQALYASINMPSQQALNTAQGAVLGQMIGHSMLDASATAILPEPQVVRMISGPDYTAWT